MHWSFINPFPNKPWFLRVCNTSLLKTLWEKEKLLVASNFSFSHSVFYLFIELSAIFRQIWYCRLQSLLVWNSVKFVHWERVKTGPNVLIIAFFSIAIFPKSRGEWCFIWDRLIFQEHDLRKIIKCGKMGQCWLPLFFCFSQYL